MKPDDLLSQMKNLSVDQQAILVALLTTGKAPKKHRDADEKDWKSEDDKVFEVTITHKCILCGSETKFKHMSSYNQNLIREVKYCGNCEVALMERSKEELVELVIALANPMHKTWKLAQAYKPIPKVEKRGGDDEVETEHDSGGTERVQQAATSEVRSEEDELGELLHAEEFDLERIDPSVARELDAEDQ